MCMCEHIISSSLFPVHVQVFVFVYVSALVCCDAVNSEVYVHVYMDREV